MKKSDKDTTIYELKDMVVKFRDARNWKQYHSPKNLAISIAIEAAELMEHFQWEEPSKKKKHDIADELADIIFNCLNFADSMDIDIAEAFLDKFKRVEQKYPLKVFNNKSQGLKDYHRIKQAYRRGKK